MINAIGATLAHLRVKKRLDDGRNVPVEVKRRRKPAPHQKDQGELQQKPEREREA